MCVGRLPPSCQGILYGLEHHQDRGGHPAPLCSCPVASDGCGDGCGNIPVCSPHARKMFCLVLPIEPRNVRSLQQPVSAARHQGDKKPAMCPRVLSPPSHSRVTAVLQAWTGSAFLGESSVQFVLLERQNTAFQGNHKNPELMKWREGSTSAKMGNCSLKLWPIYKTLCGGFPC